MVHALTTVNFPFLQPPASVVTPAHHFFLHLLPASKRELGQMKCVMQCEEFSQGFPLLQQKIPQIILGLCQIELFF